MTVFRPACILMAGKTIRRLSSESSIFPVVALPFSVILDFIGIIPDYSPAFGLKRTKLICATTVAEKWLQKPFPEIAVKKNTADGVAFRYK